MSADINAGPVPVCGDGPDITELPRGVPAVPDPSRPSAVLWEGAIHERLTRWARLAPERVAMREDGRTWSYAEIEAHANRLAHHLIARGCAREDVVAVYANRSAELVIALLGVWKAGCAFLILDPDHPPRRLLDNLERAEPRIILHLASNLECPAELDAFLSTEGAPERIGFTGRPAPGASDELASHPTTPPDVAVLPDDLAYVVFTSGSTGYPKAVAGTHRALSHFLHWQQEAFGLDHRDRFSMLSGLAHDPLLRDVFAPIWVGGSLCIPNLAGEAQRSLSAWMSACAVTVAHLAPRLGRTIARELTPAEQGADTDGLPALRYAFFGGDLLHTRDVDRFARAIPAATLVNCYGTTETPQAVAYYVVSRPLDGETVPLGRGIADVQLILAHGTKLVTEVGRIGEIWVRTPYLARGYLRDPERNTGHFTANPFTSDPADRVFRTGDLGRYDEHGCVHFVGRSDRQVKVRGYRVAPEEIETALHAHADVEEAAVVPRAGPDGEAFLAAFIVRADSAKDTPAAGSFEDSVRTHLHASLPAPMVPSRIIEVGALPRSPNGKTDLERLRDDELPDSARPVPQRDVVHAEDAALLMGRLLTLDSVRTHDDFFELGGDSLLAMRLAAHLRERWRVPVSVRDVFERPNPVALAFCARRERLPLPAEGEAYASGRRTGALSFAQERMWFFSRLAPDSPAYNLSAAFRFQGKLDVAALQNALVAIGERQRILRASFQTVDGTPTAIFADTLPCDLEAIDVSQDPDERERSVLQHMKAPFDLERGPLLRTRLLRTGLGEHLLVVTIHHIVADGWSLDILGRQLAAGYRAATAGKPLRWPADSGVQYEDYVAWQREQVDGHLLDAQVAYWAEQLRDAGQLLLPQDRPRPLLPTYTGDAVALDIPPRLAQALKDLAAESGTSLFMCLLSALMVVLGRFAGQDDVLVGTPIAHRERTDMDDVIGLFMNTVVLRGDLSDDPTFVDFLGSMKEAAVEAYENASVPFEQVVAEVAQGRDTRRHPLFQVLMVFDQPEPKPVALPSLEMTCVDVPTIASRFDMEWYLRESGDGIRGRVEFSTDLFDGDTIGRMASSFTTILHGIATNPQVSLSCLPLIEASTRAELLNGLGRMEAPPTVDAPVHSLFVSSARAYPEQTAVISADESMTYRELDARSAAMAGRIVANGARPGSAVALLLPRSMDALVAILGVLRAGAAYVPVDPAYPEERQRYMIADSGAGLLITESGDEPEWRPGIPTMSVKAVGESALAGARRRKAEPTPKDPAYIIYTSGSTGRPKGVSMPHGALTNLIAWQVRRSRAAAGSRTAQFASLSFDVSFQEMLSAWACGATLVAVPDAVRRDPVALLELLRTSHVERLFLPVVSLQHLAEAAVRRQRFPDRLREVITAGEALRITDEVRAFFQAMPGCTLENQYGPSESHVVTAHRLSDAPARWPSLPPIGHPIDNARIYILDRHGEPVPIGVPGEIHISGTGLASGYVGAAAQSDDRFFSDPFRPGVLYRTGDRGRYRADGSIDFLGRLDRQVKVRGHRVEPQEIEVVLESREDIARAIVTVDRDQSSYVRLHAHLVAIEGATPPAQDLHRQITDLRRWLSARLPEHMIPSSFRFLERLPLTSSGKVDRASLPTAAPEPRGATSRFEPPRGAIEVGLASMWGDLLDVHDVGVTDDFFERGGHSLLAVRLMARIENRFGVALPLATLFEHSTVGELAARIASDVGLTRETVLVPIRPDGDQNPFFCVHPAGGTVLCYAPLGEHLQAGVPLYGLQSWGQAEGSVMDGDVERMAERYIAAMREAQASGPYALGGWSMGGVVAFEMARRLLAIGESISTLTLFDSYAPTGTDSSPVETVALDHFALQLGLDPSGLPQDLLAAGKAEAEHLDVLLAEAIAGDLLPPDTDASRLHHLFHLLKNNVRAMRRFSPQRLPRGLTLFRAKGGPAGSGGPGDHGWERWTEGPVRVEEVPGNHHTMMREPNVSVLSRHLGEALAAR